MPTLAETTETAASTPDFTTLPWIPKLLANNDAQLCDAFLTAEHDAFLTGTPSSWAGQARVLNWQRASSDNAPEVLSVLDQHGNAVFDQYLTADVDNDGDVDTIATSHVTRNFFIITSYLIFDDKVRVPVATDLSEGDWKEQFPTAGSMIRLDEPFDTPNGPNLHFLLMPFETSDPIRIIVYEDQTYFTLRATLEDGMNVSALARMSPDRSFEMPCLIQIELTQDDASFIGRLEEVSKLAAATQASLGAGNERCAGRHQYSMTLGARSAAIITASMRPWLLATAAIDQQYQQSVVQLVQWGERSISTWRELNRFPNIIDAAADALEEHYITNFGVGPDVARRWSSNAVRHFINESYWWTDGLRFPLNAEKMPLDLADAIWSLSSKDAAQWVHDGNFAAGKLDGLMLNALILRSDPNHEVSSILARKPDFEAGREPAIIYALGQPGLIKTLLAASAPINAANDFGKTALMYAAQDSDLDSTIVLLENAADVNLLTSQLKVCGFDVHFVRTALDYAIQSGSQEMIDLLREHGAMTAEELSAENAVQH